MNFFNHFKIGARLGGGFGLLMVFLVAVSALGLVGLSRMHNQLTEIVDVNNEEGRLAGVMSLSINEIGTGVRDLLLIEDGSELKLVHDEIVASRARYEAAETKLASMFKDLSGTTEREKALLAKIQDIKTRAFPVFTQVIELGMTHQKTEGNSALQSKAFPLHRQWQTALSELSSFESELNAQAAAEAQKTFTDAQRLLSGLALFAFVLGVVTAIAITRSIVRPISYALRVVQTVAEGNLSSSINVGNRDEPGQLLTAIKAMQASLVKVITTVHTSAAALAASSAEIAMGNNDLSHRTESQASALEETSASIVELSGTVRQNADSAREANQLAQNASTVAIKGGDVVARVVGTMTGINESSKKIADIINVIDSIAFQTNILALNAAVEAARAGEQGRGFAVVASEVRSLAGRSADAAKEIKTLITESVVRVAQGSALVNEAGSTMAEVVSSIRRVNDIMGEISNASAAQSLTVTQVEQAVSQIDQSTQQNSALVEEMAASAGQLKTQAQEMVSAVESFKLEPEYKHTARRLQQRNHSDGPLSLAYRPA